MSRHRNPSTTSIPWTPARLHQMKALWLAGSTANQIARELGGISRSAVLSKVHRLGIGRPAPAPKKLMRPITQAEPAIVAPPRLRQKLIPTITVCANGNLYPTPPVVPLPPLRTVEARNPRPLVNLGDRDCRNPVNDGEHPRHGWLYCGEPVTGPGQYCARCRSILIDHEATAEAARTARRLQARPFGFGTARRHSSATSVWLC